MSAAVSGYSGYSGCNGCKRLGGCGLGLGLKEAGHSNVNILPPYALDCSCICTLVCTVAGVRVVLWLPSRL